MKGGGPARTVGRLLLAGVLVGTAALVGAAPAGAATSFNDVPRSSLFYGDITWLVEKGITSGYPDGGFHPTSVVGRQAMAAFLFKLANPNAGLPACDASRFDDVSASNPFCGDITWLVDAGITTGYPDGGFHPTSAVSRQAMAAFLFKLANPDGRAPACDSTAFVDVSAGNPFCGDITWLVGQGITGGYDDGGFHPTAAVSRQAMAAFLHRLRNPAPAASPSHYVRDLSATDHDPTGPNYDAMKAVGRADAASAAKFVLLDIGAQLNNKTGVQLTGKAGTLLSYTQLGYALQGYLDGLGSASSTTVAIGTNNDAFDWTGYSASQRGTDWANKVVDPLRAGAPSGVTIVGANDIEAGFASTQIQAAQWESAYLAATDADLVFNGSADGCPTGYGASGATCNHGWTQAQYYALAGGNDPARIQALPQVYKTEQARQWANIDASGGGHIAFTGTLTQHGLCGDSCSLTPALGWLAMWDALTAVDVPATLPVAADIMA